ncbi:hypothetical protein [Micrococcus luteus]|uniref:hypothetical protein n=1 Tax=Micrococcus luteus TaxID=1270 RepID=UPI0014744E12|nr:hypothetical protein [Micrococcus luteus]NME16424.1 hypothetical protein [Micrococcus luteus]
MADHPCAANGDGRGLDHGQPLHGLGGPVVTSPGLPTGRAMAADWTQAELLLVGDDELAFDGKNRTENNTFRLMYEGRYGFRVKRPFDFVTAHLP